MIRAKKAAAFTPDSPTSRDREEWKPDSSGRPARRARGARFRKEASMKTVRDVMTPSPATLRSSDPVAQAARVMRDEDVGSVPVIDEGTIAGIITDRDIATKVVAEGIDPDTASVSEFMSSDLVTGRPEMTLRDAAHLMARHQIRRLPVLDQNRLIGIVALADLATEPDDGHEAEEALEEISQPAR